MTGITLDNTNYGGGVEIILYVVIDYRQTSTRKYASKRIPGKLLPELDTMTFVTEPTVYRVQALVTENEKFLLKTMFNEACTVEFFDKVGFQLVQVTNLDCNIKSGNETYPWIANIELTGEDN